jgi:hypothetical protein
MEGNGVAGSSDEREWREGRRVRRGIRMAVGEYGSEGVMQGSEGTYDEVWRVRNGSVEGT